ncbi:hypothetical protein [Ferrimonas senticii]|uniref:hypothetical protein n=1 Tax=Ferrimonas senticii TaxID=394566 RepID=UPI000489429A|nr:hypothetical protein [Ferrimonas senticii]
MWRWVQMVTLLITVVVGNGGCSTTDSMQEPPVLLDNSLDKGDFYAHKLVQALNQQDELLLLSAFTPAHPLAQVDSGFSDDPAWQKMASGWMQDIINHGLNGQWQLRHVEPLASGANRYQLRLIHSDFSVEYFYFDGQFDQRGLRLEDMGNRLYRFSQVRMMQQLYLRIALDDSELADAFGDFFDSLSQLSSGNDPAQAVLAHYGSAPVVLQQDRLLKEMLLRSLMSQSDRWMDNLNAPLQQALLADDYPLMMAVICLQQEQQQCHQAYQQLPPDLRGDVALATEIGIRQLHRADYQQAQRYADVALASEVDYFPAYWLGLQLGIVSGDHHAALASLDSLVRRFDVDVNRDIATQLYPELGKQFLQSASFRRWAERYSEVESN